MLAERVTEWTEEWKQLGRVEGLAEGRTEGLVKGRTEGLAEGLQAGEAALIIRLLELRFGPIDGTNLSRIHRADPDTLFQWGERALTVNSLEDVFKPHGI